MKTTCRIRYIAALFLFYSTVLLHAEETLDRYRAEAALNNPGLKSSFNEYLAALEKIPQAGALPDPQASFGYFIRPVETRVGPQRARISVSQMFPWFGALGAKKEASVSMAKSKYEQFRQAKSLLFFEVASAYYRLYIAQKTITITNENLSFLNVFRRLALSKVEAGQASTVDVLRVDMEIADLENSLALQKDGFAALQSGFNNLLHRNDSVAVVLPETLVIADLNLAREAILDSIRNNSPQVLQMVFMASAYQNQEKAARKAGMPGIMAGIDYVVVGKSANPMTTASESGRDAVVFPMIGVSIPLYRNKYAAMAREATLMRKSIDNAKQDRINMLETTYADAEKEYRDAVRRLPLFKDQTARAKNALNILRTGYETSGSNFEEVLRMERLLLNYQLEIEKARADKGTAIASIHHLMGK